MHRLAIAATLAAACYSPSASPGGPCAPNGDCPSGQECRSNVCYPIGTPADATDAPLVDAPDAPIATLAWGAAVQLLSLETPGNEETDPSVTADKLTAVLIADSAANDSDIYIATRTALTDTFTYSLLTELNAATFNDRSPEISGDGQTIYFTSNRSGSYQVYVSTFSTVWAIPSLAADLSSASDDSDLAISPDGLTAAVVRTGAPNRIYIYSRASTSQAFSGATVHTELNVTSDISSPTITNGGEVIYFHAGSPRDLYRATLRGNGSYTNPDPVTELNTATRDAAPFVMETDNYMIFERDRDIYESKR